MKYIINKKLSCDKCVECSDILREKIENKFNCKLMANNEKDTVHGYITIFHEKNNHIITVEFYDQDKTRNNLATFKKLSKIPSESEIKEII